MTNQYLWTRLAGHDPDLRAADEDRERIAERLRQGHTEGRLDMAEFQERLEHCYEARTIGELGALVNDLPRESSPDRRTGRSWLHLWAWRLPVVPILIALFVLAATSGHDHNSFWLWIPLVFVFWRVTWWRRRRSWTGPRSVGGL